MAKIYQIFNITGSIYQSAFHNFLLEFLSTMAIDPPKLLNLVSLLATGNSCCCFLTSVTFCFGLQTSFLMFWNGKSKRSVKTIE